MPEAQPSANADLEWTRMVESDGPPKLDQSGETAHRGIGSELSTDPSRAEIVPRIQRGCKRAHHGL